MPPENSPILQKAVAILDCFTHETPSLGVRQAARKTGLSPSAAGRLMQSLRELGILNQDANTQQYALGSRVLTWAGVYSAALDVRSIALPAMQELHRDTLETISLYVLEGSERVCVERLESPQNVRIVARLGRRLPLYAGSAGKVFLAFMPAWKRDEILASTELVPLTPHTICDKEMLLKELETIRRQGYAVSTGEWLVDASGVAAPVFDQGGSISAALTISGPAQRFTPERIEEYGRMVTRVAREVSNEMGFH
jgi:IclR family transcriptional regulator, KDG regulon repressor